MWFKFSNESGVKIQPAHRLMVVLFGSLWALFTYSSFLEDEDAKHDLYTYQRTLL